MSEENEEIVEAIEDAADEAVEENTETDGASNWDRMNTLIRDAVEDIVGKKLKEWSPPAVKNSSASQKKQAPSEEKKPREQEKKKGFLGTFF